VPGAELTLEVGPFTLLLQRAAPQVPQTHSEGGAEEAAWRQRLHGEMIEALDLRRLDVDQLDERALRGRTEAAIDSILQGHEEAGRLPAGVDRSRLRKDLADEALGLGPLEELLADPGISEVMVNGPAQIYVEREGRLSLAPVRFSSDQAVLAVIERIAARVGRRIDESSPMVDARLADGSRVCAIIAPLSLIGPCLTIRKFRNDRLSIGDLVRAGALNEEMRAFLELAVGARKNIVISGGTGSGKTTLLNALTESIPATERILTVEDAAELQIRQPHWIRLECRPPNVEGKGAIGIRELVHASLRMRPDRIVVGECRGGEALDMLQAMNTGHDGSLTTLHANTPRDALARLETLCLMGGIELPSRAIREQIASAIDLIVQQTRAPDGSRKITSITEVVGMEGEAFTLQEIFRYDRGHRSSGFVPSFVEEAIAQGKAMPLELFLGER
jgi:pilus assembly protein CpaF